MNNSRTFNASYTTTRAAIKATDVTVSAFANAGKTVGTAFGDVLAGIRRARADARMRTVYGLPTPRA